MTGAANRIDSMFARKRESGEAAMFFYVTAGYPDSATTLEVIEALEEAGADLIELGIPFSDPIADGPTIQKASQKALEAGMSVRGAIELTRRIRESSDIPILLFGAYNPILRFGLKKFCDEALNAGTDGLLVPDLPPDEADELERLARDRDMRMVYLVAPTTSPERARMIASHSTGFIYYISLRGVTGAREAMASDLREKVAALRQATSLPIAVGFGVSTPDHARLVGEAADGVVVGSALIDLIAEHAGTAALKHEVTAFARSLIEALPVGKAPVASS